MHKFKNIIIGAGPTGIGAALYFKEQGFEDFLVIEAAEQAGGLAGSIVDEQGFTWDLGGHVQFSHYEIFDEYMEKALGKDGWFSHQRESWVWMRDRFIPYPFQYNLHRLPKEEKWQCLKGLLGLQKKTDRPAHFKEWILVTFGAGIADAFLFPYNFKVWAFPLEMMDFKWVGERVAIPETEKVLKGICLEEDQVSWGPNHQFKFPKFGGTGAIWQALGKLIPAANIRYGDRATSVDTMKKTVRLKSGAEFQYENLISTIPVDHLTQLSNENELHQKASKLLYSNVHIVGIGIDGQPPEELKTKCWMYFPEANCPFYRVTVFSNYSPNNTPRPGKTWSLMAEVSQSPFKPVNKDQIIEDVVQGMLAAKLLKPSDKILSRFSAFLDHGYPTPSVGRDEIISQVLQALEAKSIYSRGRFGAWKYEVSNQDHSFMQGWEIAERLQSGGSEAAEPTLNQPNKVNETYNKKSAGAGKFSK